MEDCCFVLHCLSWFSFGFSDIWQGVRCVMVNIIKTYWIAHIFSCPSASLREFTYQHISLVNNFYHHPWSQTRFGVWCLFIKQNTLICQALKGLWGKRRPCMVVCERQNELFIPVFLAAQPAIEALKRVHIEAQMLSRLFTFSQAKKSCATFVCATRVGWVKFFLDTVFIADDRTHMIDHNVPDYLKQLKRGQITWSNSASFMSML